MSFGVIAVATTVVSAGVQYAGAKKARDKNKAAQKKYEQATKLSNQQERREFKRQVRQQIAAQAVDNLFALGGGFESSRGFSQPISTQTDEKVFLGEFDAQARLGQEARKLTVSAQNTASRYSSAASLIGTLGSAGQSLYDQGFFTKDTGSTP